MNYSKKAALKIATGVVICMTVGALSGIATASSVETWYTTLNKPSFNPPNWLFAPVWTLLYILMGVASGLVWSSENVDRSLKTPLGFFALQLGLNALWSILFFGLENPTLAMIEILLLWSFIILTIYQFSKINKVAAWLMVPYLLWVSFASFLNAAIVNLN